MHYHLKLLFPGAGAGASANASASAGGDGGCAAVYLTLCLFAAPRAQLRHLRRAPLAAAPGARLLQARLAATSAPLVPDSQVDPAGAEAGGSRPGSGGSSSSGGGGEVWAVWRPAGAAAAAEDTLAAGPQGLDVTALHIAADASDPEAVISALRRQNAAALGAQGGPASAPPAGAGSGGPPALVQALPVQRLGGGSAGWGVLESLLWPPDHMATFFVGPEGQGPGEAVLELHLLRYGCATAGLGSEDGSDGLGNAAGAGGISGGAVAALRRQRQAQQAAEAQGRARPPAAPRQPRGRLLACVALDPSLLRFDQPGVPLLFDGLPLLAPGGGVAGAATVEAVPWDAKSLLEQLRRAAGPESRGAARCKVCRRQQRAGYLRWWQLWGGCVPVRTLIFT